MALSLVNNGDSGLIARTKINDAIDALNNMTSTTTTTSTTSTTTTINPNFFRATVDTTAVGDGYQVALPYNGAATYTGTIDWGDGTITSNSYADLYHTYATAGIYQIVIDGQIGSFNIPISGLTALQPVLKSIDKFGTQFSFGSQVLYAFNSCTALTSVSSDIPLTGDISYMFAGCSVFNCDVSGWDLSTVNNIENLFATCTLFNGNVSGWNVSNVTNMVATFANCTSFNQNLSSWNVVSLTNAQHMLFGASSFSSANLDALYNGWSALPGLQSAVMFGAESTCYTAAGDPGKTTLVGTYSWAVTDAGICP